MVNRELMALSRILTLAMNDGFILENPFRRVRSLRVDNGRICYLSADEEKRLLAALEGQQHTQRIVILALNTGMRRGEIFNLKWDDVDFAREAINVRQTKTGKDRVIPMNDRVREMLEMIRQESVSEYVFTSPKTGGRLTHVNRSFKSACKAVGLTDFRFHDLRHSAGTRLADAGVNVVVIAEILGHSSLTMTKRYTHATDAAKREAVQKLL